MSLSPTIRNLLIAVAILFAISFVWSIGRQIYYQALGAPEYIKRSNSGVQLTRDGKYEEALREFDESIRLKPGNGLTYANRGNTYIEMGQLQLAQDDYTKALQFGFDSYEVRAQRGTIFLAQSEFQLALPEYEMSIRMKPSPEAYVGLGFAQTYLGNDAEAEQSFDRAIDLGYDAARLRSAVNEIKDQRY